MRVLITGARGSLGRSLVEQWALRRPEVEVCAVGRDDVDLRDKRATHDLVDRLRPDSVIHAAARVGGIGAKRAHPTEFLMDNLLLDTSVISAAIDARVPELLYVGSAASYPEQYVRPFVESDLLTGALEPANEGYAIAKIASTKLCEYASAEHELAYRVAIPSNLYGPFDHFDLETAHLIAATLAKVHAARERNDASVSVWGDGTARREFTFAPDLAAWLVSQVGSLAAWPTTLNTGCGVDHSVAEYYEVAREVVGYEGRLEFDATKPAGVPRRLIDSSLARGFGWAPGTSVVDGMTATYEQFLTTVDRRETP